MERLPSNIEVCQKTFSNEKTLQTHKTKYHNEKLTLQADRELSDPIITNDRFYCFCGKSFAIKSINTHQIKYHPNEINQAKARALSQNTTKYHS